MLSYTVRLVKNRSEEDTSVIRKKTNKKHIFRKSVIVLLAACIIGCSLPMTGMADTTDKGDNHTGYTLRAVINIVIKGMQ